MAFRDNYEVFKEAVRSGEMQKYISGKCGSVKGKIKGFKEFARSKRGKKLIRRTLLISLPIITSLAIVIFIYSSVRSQIDSALQTAMNWVTLDANDNDETYLHESYVVTTDAGVSGCILRPQTGIYAESKISAGVGIYKADFPSGLPTTEEILNKPEVRATIEKDAKNNALDMSVDEIINQRGLTKTFMGLQVMAGGGSKPVGYADSYPNLWCIKNNSHDESEATGNINIQSYGDFFDDKGFFRVANRYGIAVKPGYAELMGYDRPFKPGDYIDVYLDNGNVIQCILIDVKRQGDSAISKGETGNYVMHGDGSIVEFVVDKTSWYGMGLSPNMVIPEFNDKVKGLVLAGSWEEDKEGTGASCTKFKTTDEYKTEGTVTSIGDGGASSSSSTSSDKSTTVKGEFPSNVKTIEQALKEDGNATSSQIADRGTTKSLMGWQTQGTKYSGGLKSSQILSSSDSYLLGRIPHDYNGGGHATDDKVGEYTSSMSPQWAFMWAVHNDNHSWEESNKVENKMNRKDINKFNSDGLAYVNGRYVVAVKPGLGEIIWGEETQIGDAIDIYLDDGTIIPAWVGEQKGSENSSKIVHTDGSIVEFIVDCNKFYDCCVNTHDNTGVGKVIKQITDVYPEWKQPIKGITKVGNWFENNGEVDSPANSAGEQSQDETAGWAYLDENGEPCDPDGETGTCSGADSWEDNFGATPGQRTLKNFLATACSVMGRSTYVWGGGHANYNSIGIKNETFEAYKYLHDNNLSNDEKRFYDATAKSADYIKGFDCSGYVGWVVYNTMNTEDGKANLAHNTAYIVNSYTGCGWGDSAGTSKISGDVRPGDIMVYDSGGNGHVVIIIGKTEDGGTVEIHAPESGCNIELSGVGSKGAEELAAKYNDIINESSSKILGTTDWFPLKKTITEFTRDEYGSNKRNDRTMEIFRWYYDEKGLQDPDGILNMTAEEILELIIGDGMGTGDCEEGASEPNGKIIFLDPGHGPDLKQDESTMKANGYIQNNGKWGEWRHFGDRGTVGTNCGGGGDISGSYASAHNCWFNYDPRGVTEPTITWGICEKLKPLLEKAGFTVVMSRTKDEHPSVTKRAEDAWEAGADIQICVHSNASAGAGTAYCDPTGSAGVNMYKGSDWLSQSLKLNQSINKGIVNSGAGLVEHSPIPGYGYLILYEKATCPTAYLEIGDMGISHDLSILQSDEGQQKIAEGILAGVKEYYGMK